MNENARNLLRQYRASISPEPQDSEMAWAAIAERVRQQPKVERWRWSRSSMLVGGVVAMALAASLLLIVQPNELLQSRESTATELSLDASEREAALRATESRHVDPNVQTVEVSPVEVPTVPPPEPPKPIEHASEKAPTKSKAHRSEPMPSTPEPAEDLLGKIQAEGRLLHEARAELTAGRPRRTIALVREHANAFPRGTMREEMELLEVRAWCALGDEAHWASARQQFEQRHPSSPLRAHLLDACER